MPTRATALTGAAGEHFVAYKLSGMGYPVALTRGGSPAVDLMVGDLQGRSAVSIQVKTSDWAWRGFKRKTENNHWEWTSDRRRANFEATLSSTPSSISSGIQDAAAPRRVHRSLRHGS